eukprot:TRINITY_DN3235_c1_g1_i1.p1 TRINITY_DN3235_c1_g1~~TRINITY_DN3235_c1_g1_i1.p1  ORF type:complete len:1286 (+),score=262.83 TRINITY_DN3235_c1_g1_i1:97-3954(+)
MAASPTTGQRPQRGTSSRLGKSRLPTAESNASFNKGAGGQAQAPHAESHGSRDKLSPTSLAHGALSRWQSGKKGQQDSPMQGGARSQRRVVIKQDAPAPPPQEPAPAPASAAGPPGAPPNWGALRNVVKSGHGVVTAVLESKDQTIEQIVAQAEEERHAHRDMAEKLNKIIMDQRAMIVKRDQELAEAKRDNAAAYADIQSRDAEVAHLTELLQRAKERGGRGNEHGSPDAPAAARSPGESGEPGAPDPRQILSPGERLRQTAAALSGKPPEPSGDSRGPPPASGEEDVALRARAHLLQVRLRRVEERLYHSKKEERTNLERLKTQAHGVAIRWEQVRDHVRERLRSQQRWLQAQMRKVWGFAQISSLSKQGDELGADTIAKIRSYVEPLAEAANELLGVFADEQFGDHPFVFRPVDLTRAGEARRRKSLESHAALQAGAFKMVETDDVAQRKDVQRQFNDVLAGVTEVTLRCKQLAAAVLSRQSIRHAQRAWLAKLEESEYYQGIRERLCAHIATHVDPAVTGLVSAADAYWTILNTKVYSQRESDRLTEVTREAVLAESRPRRQMTIRGRSLSTAKGSESQPESEADEAVIRGRELVMQIDELPVQRVEWILSRVVARARYRVLRRMWLMKQRLAAAEAEREEKRRARLAFIVQKHSASGDLGRAGRSSMSQDNTGSQRGSLVSGSHTMQIPEMGGSPEPQGKRTPLGKKSPRNKRSRSPQPVAVNDGGSTGTKSPRSRPRSRSWIRPKSREPTQTCATQTLGPPNHCPTCAVDMVCVQCTLAHKLELIYPPQLLTILRQHQDKMLLIQEQLIAVDQRQCELLNRMIEHLAELGLVPGTEGLGGGSDGISQWILHALGRQVPADSPVSAVNTPGAAQGLAPARPFTPSAPGHGNERGLAATSSTMTLHTGPGARTPTNMVLPQQPPGPRPRPLSPACLTVGALQAELSVPVAAFLAAHPGVIALLHEQSVREEEDLRFAQLQGTLRGVQPPLPGALPSGRDRRHWEGQLREERVREIRRRDALRQLAQGLAGNAGAMTTREQKGLPPRPRGRTTEPDDSSLTEGPGGTPLQPRVEVLTEQSSPPAFLPQPPARPRPDLPGAAAASEGAVRTHGDAPSDGVRLPGLTEGGRRMDEVRGRNSRVDNPTTGLPRHPSQTRRRSSGQGTLIKHPFGPAEEPPREDQLPNITPVVPADQQSLRSPTPLQEGPADEVTPRGIRAAAAANRKVFPVVGCAIESPREEPAAGIAIWDPLRPNCGFVAPDQLSRKMRHHRERARRVAPPPRR